VSDNVPITLDVPRDGNVPFQLVRLGPWTNRLQVVVEDANENQLASLDVAPGQQVVFYLPPEEE